MRMIRFAGFYSTETVLHQWRRPVSYHGAHLFQFHPSRENSSGVGLAK